jgi:hypothetical protein
MLRLKQHLGEFATFSRRYAATPHPLALSGCHLPLKGKALVRKSKKTARISSGSWEM